MVMPFTEDLRTSYETFWKLCMVEVFNIFHWLTDWLFNELLENLNTKCINILIFYIWHFMALNTYIKLRFGAFR